MKFMVLWVIQGLTLGHDRKYTDSPLPSVLTLDFWADGLTGASLVLLGLGPQFLTGELVRLWGFLEW